MNATHDQGGAAGVRDETPPLAVADPPPFAGWHDPTDTGARIHGEPGDAGTDVFPLGFPADGVASLDGVAERRHVRRCAAPVPSPPPQPVPIAQERTMPDTGATHATDPDEHDEDEFADPDLERAQSDYLKFAFDGTADLSDLASRMHGYATHVEGLAADGWRLDGPVDGGWVRLRRDPPGDVGA